MFVGPAKLPTGPSLCGVVLSPISYCVTNLPIDDSGNGPFGRQREQLVLGVAFTLALTLP